MAGWPPKKNTAFDTVVSLTSQVNTNVFQTNPTLAAGDVTVSKDGGNPVNITTLPTVINAGELVSVSLSASEMDADRVAVLFHDVAGAEWQDLTVTLHTSAGQVGDLTAAGIWSYASRTLTMSTLAVRSMLRGTSLEVVRGDTLQLNFTRLGDLSGRANLWFTLKDDLDDTDGTARIQIDENNGLLYIAGAAATTPANGSIAVTDAARGNLTVTLAAVEAAKLATDYVGYWDIQTIDGSGVVTTLTRGKGQVLGDVTRATS